MKESKVVSRRSTQYKFVVLQLLAILLVAFTLVAFSDIKLPFLNKAAAGDEQKVFTGVNTSTDDDNKKLRRLEKSVEDKEAKISELENQLKAAQSTGNKNSSSSSSDAVVRQLQASLQKAESESKNLLADKDTRIRQLEQQLQTAQNDPPATTSASDAASLNRLRADVQRLETRNALLEKLNSDLKKNNEYLSERLKENE